MTAKCKHHRWSHECHECDAEWKPPMTPHQTPPSVPTDEMVERIAAIIDPRAFVGTPEEIHMYCSPVAVEYVQAHALARAREIVAALAAMPVAEWRVPEGWKLVPEEPSNEMLDASWEQSGESKDMRLRYSARMRKHWEIMLSAAPLPPAPQPGSGWRPASQPPEADGEYLLYRPDAPKTYDPVIRIATWEYGKWDCIVKPTHWQPLPAPPAAQEWK